MSNSYFKFKQFTIYQDKCAMKVCTDSCLFGGIVAKEISTNENVLDIGCGTGLLSLMYTQINKASVDAIEIDKSACEQAIENIATASFIHTINIYNCNVLEFQFNKKYKLIICNPPFFINSLTSNNTQRNQALHVKDLTFEKLVKVVANNLEVDGIFAVLLPFEVQNNFIELVSQLQLFCNKIFNIKQTTTHQYFRTILFFSFKNKTKVTTVISIKNAENQYSKEFKKLLKDFYLAF